MQQDHLLWSSEVHATCVALSYVNAINTASVWDQVTGADTSWLNMAPPSPIPASPGQLFPLISSYLRSHTRSFSVSLDITHMHTHTGPKAANQDSQPLIL